MAVSIHGTLQVFGHNGLKLASQLPVVSALRFHGLWTPLLSLFDCAIFRLHRGSSKSKEGEVVSIADIESAERLVGIAYTAAERDQMVGNLEGQIASAIARRKLRFDNSTPTASRFDPRLPNFRMPAQGSPRFSRIPVRPLPADEADIAFASIGELAAWISVGALASRRLTEIYLSRIDALGPRLECFATVTAKRALAEADAADALLRGGKDKSPSAAGSSTPRR